MRFLLLAVLLAVLLPIVLTSSGASAQSVDVLLESEACRRNPHSEDCICAGVRRFAFFPIAMDENPADPAQPSADADEDGFRPGLVDGVWVDHASESDDVGNTPPGLATELQFVLTDDYGQNCALSYFRENLRRLWVFGVALGAVFASISFIWIGVTHMQHTASGMDISRSRMMFVRVGLGIIILACALVVWEGLNDYLLEGLQGWTNERNVFYNLLTGGP